MERITFHPSPGPLNSLQYWGQFIRPLRVVRNFLIVYLNRYLPSEGLKNVLYRWTGMKVGRHCSFGLCAMVDAFFPHLITVGENCLFGYDSVLLAHEFLQGGLRTGPVVIGNDVTVGTKSTVLPGVVIGDGAVISAMSLVNKDVPPYHIVGGVPIRALGMVPESERRASATRRAPSATQTAPEERP
ncbi:MAG: acyltransferase [Anaerolineae bacterium]|nr:acyltransferase [Anaerolineae bacterium]